jgi:hypothetical protein
MPFGKTEFRSADAIGGGLEDRQRSSRVLRTAADLRRRGISSIACNLIAIVKPSARYQIELTESHKI